jgi:hypothetical protein
MNIRINICIVKALQQQHPIDSIVMSYYGRVLDLVSYSYEAAVGNSALVCCRYEIFTVSKPATPLAQITKPLVRYQQRQFGRQSGHKMAEAVADHTAGG